MYVASNWDRLYNGSAVMVSPLSNEVEATLVSTRERERDSYGDYTEGDSEISMVFKVGDRYFRKTGYQSSYDDGRTWDGAVVEVKATVKTVTIYE